MNMESQQDVPLFEDIVISINRLDQGMTFHSESCDVCLRHKRSWTTCEEWLDMVEQWNFLNLAVVRHVKSVAREDS